MDTIETSREKVLLEVVEGGSGRVDLESEKMDLIVDGVGDVESLITGMRLCDEEGVVATTDVKAKFHRGNPSGITAVLVLSNPTEWDRFMRFMTRFAAQSGLAFTAADADAA